MAGDRPMCGKVQHLKATIINKNFRLQPTQSARTSNPRSVTSKSHTTLRHGKKSELGPPYSTGLKNLHVHLLARTFTTPRPTESLMPKNPVSDPINDQEIAFARRILSGTMTD